MGKNLVLSTDNKSCQEIIDLAASSQVFHVVLSYTSLYLVFTFLDISHIMFKITKMNDFRYLNVHYYYALTVENFNWNVYNSRHSCYLSDEHMYICGGGKKA